MKELTTAGLLAAIVMSMLSIRLSASVTGWTTIDFIVMPVAGLVAIVLAHRLAVSLRERIKSFKNRERRA